MKIRVTREQVERGLGQKIIFKLFNDQRKTVIAPKEFVIEIDPSQVVGEEEPDKELLDVLKSIEQIVWEHCSYVDRDDKCRTTYDDERGLPWRNLAHVIAKFHKKGG